LPQVLEEIRGIGDGAGLSYAHTFFAAVQDGMPLSVEKRASCTAFSCGRGTTAFNNILLGQTKDTNAPLDRYRIMHIAYNSGRRILLLNYPGWIANICVTSDGLSFAGNSIYGERPPNDTVPFSFLKRMVMEKSSVSQVLDAIDNLTFENSCFLIGDSTGHLVCLEHLAGLRSLHDVTHQAFGHANSVLSLELKKYESATTVSCSSALRQRNIEKLLDRARGSITVESMKHILADHADFPLSICRHIAECDPNVTTAAFVANLTNLTMDIAIGNPCVAEFRSYQV
jgi:isopenicillin-N N-acyltransferase-like protein